MKNIKKIFSDTPLSIDSAESMRDLGRQFASCLEAGDVIGLVGDLGAGKTHFVQGVLAGLGVEEAVVSPTFALVHEYEGAQLSAAHFDFYRMQDASEAIGIGWDDYLYDTSKVLLVEWADRFDGTLMPSTTCWISIKYSDTHTRHVFCVKST